VPPLHAAANNSTIIDGRMYAAYFMDSFDGRPEVVFVQHVERLRVDELSVAYAEPEPAEIRYHCMDVGARPGRDQPQDSVVGHDAEDARTDVRQRARQGVVEAGEYLVVVLASGWRGELTAAPGGAQARPAPVDLVGGAALPLSAVTLAEPFLGEDGRLEVGGHDLGGARRASQIGAVQDARAEPVAGEHPGPGCGLGLAGRGERCVEPPLPAPLDVPRRLAVTEDQDALHGMTVKQSRFDPAFGPRNT